MLFTRAARARAGRLAGGVHAHGPLAPVRAVEALQGLRPTIVSLGSKSRLVLSRKLCAAEETQRDQPDFFGQLW